MARLRVRRRRLASQFLLLVALVGAVLVGAPGAGDSAEPSAEVLSALELTPLPRAAAPAFTLADLDGRALSLASLRGQTVLIYFWATWCPYCQKELPTTVQELARRYRDRRLVVLAVNMEEGRDKVRAWAKKHGISVPVLLDGAGEVSGDYRVTATPTAVLVDRDGRTVARAVGTRSWTSDRARPLWDILLANPAQAR
jgi:peroxiredoxin